MNDFSPHRDFEPDRRFEEEAYRFMQGSTARTLVDALQQRELQAARGRLDVSDIHRLPVNFTDGDLERFAARGVSLRFIPFERDDPREVPAALGDLFEQVVDRPGWYATYDRPLDRQEIALRFMTSPPETVADFFKCLDLIQTELPGDPRERVLLANVPELLWLIHRDRDALRDREVLLGSAPAFSEAVSVKFDPTVEPSTYNINERFDGVIYPLRRIAA
ncbi:MAG: hypothetical protein Q8Q11_03955 [bacterium]|nr:hypothetical protein [bacterium]MDZ4247710.1 hypothetical protein [Patescibacteria group bacterium]